MGQSPTVGYPEPQVRLKM